MKMRIDRLIFEVGSLCILKFIANYVKDVLGPGQYSSRDEDDSLARKLD